MVSRQQRQEGSIALRLGPADRVTLVRATFVAAVCTIVVNDLFRGSAHAGVLVPLTCVALVLDGVDGWVARRTGTASEFGARFDMEVDAFLLLVLSAYVARTAGLWVLSIGAMRYAFVAAGWLWPFLQRRLPPRYWRKVVAVAQALALVVAVSALLPPALSQALVAGALALLVESFGRDVFWLWRRRRVDQPEPSTPAARGATSTTRINVAGLFAQRTSRTGARPDRPASPASRAPVISTRR
jgi:phosphatidylglycerophosphate synthase